MQFARDLDTSQHMQVGWGLRALYLSGADMDEVQAFAKRLAGMGAAVSHQDDRFGCIQALMDDPMSYGLLVVDCDGIGGLDIAHKVCATLAAHDCEVPVILFGREVTEQSFPSDRSKPVLLRAPLSSVALRVAVEFAVRDRMALSVA